MPPTKRKINYRKKTIRKRKSIRKKYMKGGNDNGTIPNYALNTFEQDPNYMQIASRQVIQYGSASKKMKKMKKMKAGGIFDFVSNQLSNPITNFISSDSANLLYDVNNPNSAPYVQPISKILYTGSTV
jgi:hypothetical protein